MILLKLSHALPVIFVLNLKYWEICHKLLDIYNIFCYNLTNYILALQYQGLWH